MPEDIDGAVKWLMKRLMEASAESFDLAFARYEASEREAALAQARRLIESQDPAERELGERLRAEVLKEQKQHVPALMVDGPAGNGVADPLSRLPSPSSPGAATPLPAPEAPQAAQEEAGQAAERPDPQDQGASSTPWTLTAAQELVTPEGDRVSVAVRVVGVSEAEVTTAIAIEPRRGRPFRAIVGAQVERCGR